MTGDAPDRDDETAVSEFFHTQLDPEQRVKSMCALGCVGNLIQHCLQTGYGGEVTVTLHDGRLRRVEGCLEDGEKVVPINFHDWTA